MLSQYFMQVSNIQPTLLQEKETKLQESQRGFVKHLNKYQRHAIINNYDETIEPTEMRENYYITNCPTIKPASTFTPTIFNPHPLNYTCICKSEKNEDTSRFIALIVATSLTSFSCVLLIFIIWYKLLFKKKLLNNYDNNCVEQFGIDASDINDI